MVNFGPLTAEIGWRVWSTPTNFKGFRVMASLLHRRRSMKVSQTLHNVWPSSELVHYMHFWGLLSPTEILPGAILTLRPSLPFSYIYWQRYCTAPEQWASAKLCGVLSSRDRAAIPFDIGRSDCLFFLSLYLSVCLCVCMSIYLSVYLSLYLSIYSVDYINIVVRNAGNRT